MQHNKLRYSGLTHYFEHVITSEGSNSLKPNKEIFDFAFRKTGGFPDNSIMIGDTPEVDILGAQNAGMDQVFVNYKKIKSTIPSTFEVFELKQLEEIF
ncbi:MAG: HAD-IA family hydrolase [Chitinophagaceae bacterium]|nr:HAD-IA family hydrolase [Chitinophagaceae bacterium]